MLKLVLGAYTALAVLGAVTFATGNNDPYNPAAKLVSTSADACPCGYDMAACGSGECEMSGCKTEGCQAQSSTFVMTGDAMPSCCSSSQGSCSASGAVMADAGVSEEAAVAAALASIVSKVAGEGCACGECEAGCDCCEGDECTCEDCVCTGGKCDF